MAQSYFAVIPKSTADEAIAHTLAQEIKRRLIEYHTILDAPGLILLVAGSGDKGINTYVLNDGQGVVIGTLFSRAQGRPSGRVDRQIDQAATKAIVNSKGAKLLENYWGRYAAFLYDGQTRLPTVIRDPSGSIPIFYFETKNLIICFSEMEHFAALRLTSLTFNYEHIAFFTRLPLMDYPDTGFNEISKLVPGQGMTIADGNVTKSVYWHPRQFCEGEQLKDAQTATRILRETVEDVVQSWAGLYDNIIHRLSGGLDSTIVLAALKNPSPQRKITAICYYSDGIDSDERERAKNAAEYYDIELLSKKDVASEVDLSLITEFRVSAEPIMSRHIMAKATFERDLASRLDADVYFSGEGGDGIFGAGSRFFIEDYISRNGFDRGIASIIQQISQVSQRSVWEILGKALRCHISGHDWDITSDFSDTNSVHFLSQDFNKQIDVRQRFAHWLPDLERIPAAKQLHVATTRLSTPLRRSTHPKNEISWCHPLLSQPLLEVVYRIPTYLFCHTGADRGLARMAFKDQGPKRNIFAQSKGGINNFYQEIIRLNHDFLRDYIMSSTLIKDRILSKESVEKALHFSIEDNIDPNPQIIDIMGAVIYCNRWKHSI